MNTNQCNHLTDVTEERLDRLVDGELSRDEYRELLEALDRAPDGWRRCALAFLEAQAWQRELSVVRAEGFAGAATESRATESNASDTRSTGGGGGAGWAWSTWAGRLALAASWFLVFTMGAGTYQALFTGDAPISTLNPVGATSRSGFAAKAENGNSLAASDGPSVGGSGRGGGGENPSESSGLEFQIADPHGNVLDRFVMPVSESGTSPGPLVTTSEPTVPNELADAARALKLDLRTNRTWIPVSVPNGGNVMVPLDHIELQPRPARPPY